MRIEAKVGPLRRAVTLVVAMGSFLVLPVSADQPIGDFR